MKNYALYTKVYDKNNSKRDIINQTQAQSFKEAVEYFAKMKNIHIEVIQYQQ